MRFSGFLTLTENADTRQIGGCAKFEVSQCKAHADKKRQLCFLVTPLKGTWEVWKTDSRGGARGSQAGGRVFSCVYVYVFLHHWDIYIYIVAAVLSLRPLAQCDRVHSGV